MKNLAEVNQSEETLCKAHSEYLFSSLSIFISLKWDHLHDTQSYNLKPIAQKNLFTICQLHLEGIYVIILAREPEQIDAE